jgi:hypothetical protein
MGQYVPVTAHFEVNNTVHTNAGSLYLSRNVLLLPAKMKLPTKVAD